MPSFTSRTPNLRDVGPLVEVMLAVPATAERVLLGAGAAVPGPVTATAMLDTGASTTVIHPDLASQLGLTPVGVVYMSTPASSSVECQAYRVRLVFMSTVSIETTAVAAQMEGHNVECLIGRDVLAHAVFVYVGASDLFTLSF